MKSMKTIVIAFILSCLSASAMAQTVKSHVVEAGGTGPFKAEVVCDSSLPTHTVYRPQDMKAAVEAQGKLPVILYANGACANNNQQMRLLLNELCSYGYVALAIGPYDEISSVDNWKEVLLTSYPEGKQVVLANGEKMAPPTAEEVEAAKKAREAKWKSEMAPQSAKKGKKAAPAPAPFRPYNRQLLEALDWLTDQNANPNSEYYHMIDLDKVAAMGQSCGGAMVLGVSHDPRIKTCVMLNTGIGQMEMNGVSKTSLASVHTPMFYMIGGKTDVAFLNAADDFAALNHVPVVMYNSNDGHNGTYYEAHGGAFADAAHRWLDWQLKGQISRSAFFLDDEFVSKLHPDWTFQRKNF